MKIRKVKISDNVFFFAINNKLLGMPSSVKTHLTVNAQNVLLHCTDLPGNTTLYYKTPEGRWRLPT